jgi:3-oxoacyl-[acyl-carrier-protein] synthase-3
MPLSVTHLHPPLTSRIVGIGAYLPARVMTNEDMSRIVETSHEWIVERTGIHTRHIAAEGEVTSDLAAAAARDALNQAGLEPSDIDLIIVATTTPDRTFPATAAIAQRKLGIHHGAAFDVQAVCAGFVYGLATADALLARGGFRRALVIGAETFSRLLDWTDRSTCVLFGDGAGAVVLEAVAAEPGGPGVLSTALHTDGRFEDLLYVDGGPSSTGTVGQVRMVGNQVFKHAIAKISDSVIEAVARAGLSMHEVDWFVPHQANQRILDGVARKLELDVSRIVSTVSAHGNTSAASIPLALDTAVRDGRIKPGQIVVLEAIGGGLAWGAAVLRY